MGRAPDSSRKWEAPGTRQARAATRHLPSAGWSKELEVVTGERQFTAPPWGGAVDYGIRER